MRAQKPTALEKAPAIFDYELLIHKRFSLIEILLLQLIRRGSCRFLPRIIHSRNPDGSRRWFTFRRSLVASSTFVDRAGKQATVHFFVSLFLSRPQRAIA